MFRQQIRSGCDGLVIFFWSRVSYLAWLLKGTLLPPTVLALLVATCGLTLGRRAGRIFCFAVCGCTSGFARTDQIADRGLDHFVMSIVPILRDWDTRLWPDEAEYVRRIEQRNESMQLRDLALNLQSSENCPFWHHGGFRHQLHIGRDSLEWLEAA